MQSKDCIQHFQLIKELPGVICSQSFPNPQALTNTDLPSVTVAAYYLEFCIDGINSEAFCVWLLSFSRCFWHLFILHTYDGYFSFLSFTPLFLAVILITKYSETKPRKLLLLLQPPFSCSYLSPPHERLFEIIISSLSLSPLFFQLSVLILAPTILLMLPLARYQTTPFVYIQWPFLFCYAFSCTWHSWALLL